MINNTAWTKDSRNEYYISQTLLQLAMAMWPNASQWNENTEVWYATSRRMAQIEEVTSTKRAPFF